MLGLGRGWTVGKRTFEIASHGQDERDAALVEDVVCISPPGC